MTDSFAFPHPGLDDALRGIFLNSGLQVQPHPGLGARLSGNKETIITARTQLSNVSRGLQLLQQLSDDVSTVVL